MSGYYRYYDSPDGQDFFKKEYYLARKAFPFGCYLAYFDCVAVNKPTGVVPVAVRFFQTVGRPIYAVSLWNITTFMSCRLRKKDDGINHAIGVLPVAFYMKKYLPATTVWLLAVPFMIVLAGTKMYRMLYPNLLLYEETTTFRDNPNNSIFADFMSYVTLAVKEKNWITLEEAKKRGVVASEDEAKERKLTNYKDGQARGLIRVGDGTENHVVNL